MYGKYMTDAQLERLKLEQRRMLYSDTRRVEEVFPEIEKIEINYYIHHGSAFGVQNEQHSWLIKPEYQAVFVIDCLNRECSSVGFDLKNEIWSMYRTKQEEKTGTMCCEGQEAPDHPEQRCSGKLEFSIKIVYKA